MTDYSSERDFRHKHEVACRATAHRVGDALHRKMDGSWHPYRDRIGCQKFYEIRGALGVPAISDGPYLGRSDDGVCGAVGRSVDFDLLAQT